MTNMNRTAFKLLANDISTALNITNKEAEDQLANALMKNHVAEYIIEQVRHQVLSGK